MYLGCADWRAIDEQKLGIFVHCGATRAKLGCHTNVSVHRSRRCPTRASGAGFDAASKAGVSRLFWMARRDSFQRGFIPRESSRANVQIEIH